MITILTWLWRQPHARAHYTAEHVNIWADMVRRNLAMPHRIACVTDIPKGIDSRVEIIAPPGDFMDVRSPLWTNGRPQCYRRLSMFRKDAGAIFGERFVCMDLDCVIGGALDPLFDRDEDLVLYKGTRPTRPYNGSMMLISAGCRPHVFDDFDREGALKSSAEFLGSDQAWLAYRLGWGEATWDEDDGVRFYSGNLSADYGASDTRILFFPGKMKPWIARSLNSWVNDHYGIAKEAA